MKTTRRGFLKGLGAFALTTVIPKGKAGKGPPSSPAPPEPEPELEAAKEAIDELVVSTTPAWGSCSYNYYFDDFQPGDLVTVHGDELTVAKVKGVDPLELRPYADERVTKRYIHYFQFEPHFRYLVDSLSRVVDYSLT